MNERACHRYDVTSVPGIEEVPVESHYGDEPYDRYADHMTQAEPHRLQFSKYAIYMNGMWIDRGDLFVRVFVKRTWSA
jgi:hypothetical protein